MEFHDRIDKNDVGSLMKIMELLHRLNNENIGNPNDKSLVALTGMGHGMTITKTGANSVEITPKVSQFGSKLKQFAEIKRAQEKESQPLPKTSHDIIDQEQTPNEKEKEK